MQPQPQQQMFNPQMYDMQQSPGLQNQLVQQQMQMSQLFRQDQGNLFESQQEANNQQMLKKLQEKLNELKDEVLNMDKNIEIFKNHQLPLARVKKIMKSDEDVRVPQFILFHTKYLQFQMISAEAPILFAKACEIFIIELTFRAWMHTEESKRRTLQKIDIGACIQNTDIFDFLIDIIPKDEFKPNQALGAQPNPAAMDQSNQMQTGAYLNQFINSQQSQQNPGISNLMLGQQQFLQQQQQNNLQQQQNDFQMQLQQQPQNLIGQVQQGQTEHSEIQQ